jgi:hypothetical protein
LHYSRSIYRGRYVGPTPPSSQQTFIKIEFTSSTGAVGPFASASRSAARLARRPQARLTGLGPLDRQFTKSLSVADEMQLSAPNAGAAGASANYVAFRPGKRGEHIPVGTNF